MFSTKLPHQGFDMKILVINCGSSSIKADILQTTGEKCLEAIRIERLDSEACILKKGEKLISLGKCDHRTALNTALSLFTHKFKAIGHRVVHGGEKFIHPTRITTEVFDTIASLTNLAPLHIPANLAGIKACQENFPELLQVAVFDTAFHATLPRRARNYAISSEIAKKHGIRRFGFHGNSHRWSAKQVAKYLNEPIEALRIIVCHLGNGASISAIEYGRSIETSMGMTPLEGLVMGTRSGDVDPGVLISIAQKEGWSLEELDHFLNKVSGLKGLSGVGNDMRDILEKAREGDDNCRLAINVFVHRLRKYIGAYAAVLGGVDALVFTGGIGENATVIRARACQNLGFLGFHLDEDRNQQTPSSENPIIELSRNSSRKKIFAVRADEEMMIAKDTRELVKEQDHVSQQRTIPIAISARHVHLTQEAVEILFGEGASLTKRNDISQPGQYACHEKVDLIGPKRTIKGVRVLGPTRPACQVEVSRTDEYTLGIDAPIRNSGDVKNSPSIKLVGPAGELVLKEGLICARRHIHMDPNSAEYFGVKDKDVVEVEIDSAGRDLIFGDVLVRVSPKYLLEMHIDTDEANAAEITPGTTGILCETGLSAVLRRRSV